MKMWAHFRKTKNCRLEITSKRQFFLFILRSENF